MKYKSPIKKMGPSSESVTYQIAAIVFDAPIASEIMETQCSLRMEQSDENSRFSFSASDWSSSGISRLRVGIAGYALE